MRFETYCVWARDEEPTEVEHLPPWALDDEPDPPGAGSGESPFPEFDDTAAADFLRRNTEPPHEDSYGNQRT